MNIAKPNKEDLDAVWELVAFLNKIEQGLNPIYQPADPEDEDDFQYLSDAPADEVFEALEYKSANAGLSWIMTVLDTLLSARQPQTLLRPDTARGTRYLESHLPSERLRLQMLRLRPDGTAGGRRGHRRRA